MAESSASPTATSRLPAAATLQQGALRKEILLWKLSVISAMKHYKCCGSFGHMTAIAATRTSKVRLFYNNVAELRQILGRNRISQGLSAGSEHLNFQIADLLAQGYCG